MAVAFGSVVNVTPATGANTGASPSITTPASNPVVFAIVGLNSATATVSTLTITGFGGTASQIASIRDANNGFCSIWKIVAPTANTSGTVQANLSASVPYQLVVEAFSGAHQSDPSPTGDAQTSNAPTDAHTLTPTNLVTGDASTGGAGNSGAQDLDAITPIGRYLDNTTAINMAVGDATNTTGVTFGVTGGTNYSKVAVRIVQAAAGTAHVGEARFSGVGSTSDTGFALSALQPDADSIDGTWTDQAGGTSLFAAIDEMSADDADYIKSVVDPINEICKISLGNPAATPSEPFIVMYRYKGTPGTYLYARLLEGSIEIAAWQHFDLIDTFVTAEQTLSGAQFSAITDFNNLFIELTADNGDGEFTLEGDFSGDLLLEGDETGELYL